tara:strand:- start:285 stop:497 length:213 start_codon:yes stop_codon:yes gene_type:complete
MQDDIKPYLKMKEAMKLTGLSRYQITKAVELGKIKEHKFSVKSIVYATADLLDIKPTGTYKKDVSTLSIF